MTDRRSVVASLALIVVSAAALLGATLLATGDATNGIADWPPLLRASLTGIAVAIGLALLARSVAMLEASRPDGSTTAETRDVRGLIRAVRLAFLAVAAFAAAGAFLVGHALLLVVAVVIAAVDVIETTFLLVVARTHRRDDSRES